MASLQQHPRLFWLASPRTGLQMQLHAQRKILSNCCIAGDQNRKSNDHRRTTNLNRRKTSPTGTSFFCFFFFRFAFDGVSKSPAACETPVSRRKGGTCHFAQRPEPHPPDTCQAGAETPPGRPLLAPEPRLLSASSGRSAAVGHRESPYSRRDPVPGGDAPPPRRRGARRRTLWAPFLRAARGGVSARSPGQRQVLGAAILLGVLLRRGRRGRRRGLRGGGGGCCSTGGFGRHDALAGQAPADAGGGPGREDARTSGTPRPLPTPVTKII